jgi:AcrR family transcriptional regulator
MAKVRVPRRAWVDQGLRALAEGGPANVRIETLARSLGVTKGGFYGHFADRPALLTEMLDTWEHEVTDLLIAQVDGGSQDVGAKARLRRLFDVVSVVEEDPTIGITVEFAIRDWARRDPEVARRLRQVDRRHTDYLRSLLREFCADELEVETRCLILMSVRLGDHMLVADGAAHSRAEVIERVMIQQMS